MLLDVLKKAYTNTTSTVSLPRTRSEKQQKIKELKELLRLLEASLSIELQEGTTLFQNKEKQKKRLNLHLNSDFNYAHNQQLVR